MIDEGDVLFVQCKMSLWGPKSMRKVDGLSLIFFDFYVPVLTPSLNNIETLLQLPENITFAVCCIYTAKRLRQTHGVWGGIIYVYTV
jgi:hypothetical protein